MVSFDDVEPVSDHDDDFTGIGGRGWRVGTEEITVDLGDAAGVECAEGVFSEPGACI